MNNATTLFNPQRIWRLLRIGMMDEWRPYLLSGLIIGGLIIFSTLFFGTSSSDFMFNLLLLMAIVQTSKLFSSFHTRERGIYELMLPASREEKYFIRLMMTTIGFYLYAILITMVAGETANLLSNLLNGRSALAVITPLTPGIWEKFLFFVFFHSIFFTGSLFFKSSSFLKTVGMLLLVFFLLSIIGTAILKNNLVSSQTNQFYFQFNNSQQVIPALNDSLNSLIHKVRIVIYYVIPPILYGLSFLSFRRKEVV